MNRKERQEYNALLKESKLLYKEQRKLRKEKPFQVCKWYKVCDRIAEIHNELVKYWKKEGVC